MALLHQPLPALGAGPGDDGDGLAGSTKVNKITERSGNRLLEAHRKSIVCAVGCACQGVQSAFIGGGQISICADGHDGGEGCHPGCPMSLLVAVGISEEGAEDIRLGHRRVLWPLERFLCAVAGLGVHEIALMVFTRGLKSHFRSGKGTKYTRSITYWIAV